MKNPPTTYSAAGFVLNPIGEVLLVEEFGHYWGLPRGHIEKGETSLNAAIREIWEETGIKVLELVSELGSYQRSTFDKSGQPNNKELKHITVFHFETSATTLSPKDPDITDARWFSLGEARRRLVNAADIEFFDRAVDKIKQS